MMDTRNRGWLVVVVIVVLLVLLVGPGLGWGMIGGGMMGPGMMGGWGGGFGPGWGIGMLVFWMLILAGLGLLVAWALRQGGPAETAGHRPLDIMKKRYARGELTGEQYDQMRRTLEQ